MKQKLSGNQAFLNLHRELLLSARNIVFFLLPTSEGDISLSVRPMGGTADGRFLLSWHVHKVKTEAFCCRAIRRIALELDCSGPPCGSDAGWLYDPGPAS